MTDTFFVYRIAYDELVKRLESRHQRNEVGNGKGVEFNFEEPIAINLVGTSILTRMHGTIVLSKERPYSKISVHLAQSKHLVALAVAIILASFGLYLVFWLWFVPVLLIFKASIVWFYLKYRIANKFASFTENLKKSLLD